MTNAETDALNSILAKDRPTAQRLSLLSTLQNELRGETAIQALLAAAREEKTLEIRRAFLKHCAECDITRLTGREAFIEGILYFAAAEEDASLRKIALRRLGRWSAHDPVIEDVLLESLQCEMEIDIQQICIQGLQQCVMKRPENIQKLIQFIPHSPRELRKSLIDLFQRFDSKAVQSGLVIFLDPAEPAEIRSAVLEALEELPLLEPATLDALESFIINEPDEDLQAQAIEVLRNSKNVDAGLFKTVFGLLARFPERDDLIDCVENRLASFPELVSELIQLFQKISSAQVRVRILESLEKVPAVTLFIWALHDPSPRVRKTAVACLKEHLESEADAIQHAVIAAALNESVVSVREEMASVFTSENQRADEINQTLVDWLERETEPRVEAVLANSLAAIPPSSLEGPSILRAYRKILSDPAANPALRSKVIENLADFAYQDAPELVECIKLLLERSSSIEEVDTLYSRLKELEPDLNSHTELILRLFLRFAGHFPREPLHQWLKDFESLAPSHPDIREKIPHIIKITGASWLSGSADAQSQKSTFLPALLEQIRRGNWIEAGRLMRESWENRTIRKKDMLTLFKKLLRTPGEESVMQSVLVMMAQGGMVSPEILDICFSYLEEEPRNGCYTYLIAQFVQGNNQDHTPRYNIGDPRPVDLAVTRRQDPHYRSRVFAQFSQHYLNRYFRLMPEEMKLVEKPRDWNEWEYQGWSQGDSSWCIAEMFFALKPYDRIAELVASPVDSAVSPTRAIHYVLLRHLWSTRGEGLQVPIVDSLLLSVGSLMRQTAGKRSMELLHDRAVFVFYTFWARTVNSHEGARRVPPEVAELAAEAYLAMCDVSTKFRCDPNHRFPAELPEVLQGLNISHLESIWHFDRATWDRLFKSHFEGYDNEVKAKDLLDRAKHAEEDFLYEDAFPLYSELLSSYAETRLVKKNFGNINYYKELSDPSTPPDPNLEGAAASQYEFMQSELNSGRPEKALSTLKRILKSYWRTAFLKDKRADLMALRKELLSKIPRKD